MTKAHLEIARKTILKLVTANAYIRIFSDIKQLNYRTIGCRALDKASVLYKERRPGDYQHSNVKALNTTEVHTSTQLRHKL